MEYVPLRTPAAETYHYHHVTDQTKSLQDLQNEVAALLEFRDLVIETFPDLKSKMASSAANSTLTGLPSTSSLGSRREWEPGIRIRRKLTPKEVSSTDVGGTGGSSSSIGGANTSTAIIPGTVGDGGGPSTGSASATGPATATTGAGATNVSDLGHHHHHQQQQQQQQQQHQQQQQQQHSSSSLIRSRSNSHSGKKEPKSGEGNNGSVIQDSGFSNETSSSKETHSAASSTSGAVQGTLILPTATNRLAAETGGELWNLLDVIHRKSSRLREEVELRLERERPRGTTNLAISNHHASALHHHRHHHQLHHHLAQGGSVAAAAAAAATAVVGGADDNNIIIHHSNPAAGASSGTTLVPVTSSSSSSSSSSSVTATTVVVSPGGAPATTTTASAVTGKSYHHQHQPDGTDHDVQILRKERDRLLDKLSEYEAEKLAGCIQMAKMQAELDKLTVARDPHHQQLAVVANSQKQELSSKLHDLHLQTVNRSASSSPETIKQPATVSQQQQTSPQLLKTMARYHKPSDEPADPLAGGDPVLPCDDHHLGTEVDTRAAGWLDGFLGLPWEPRVRSLDSKKIAAILLETNVVGLQRHLLTMTVQNQILQQRLDQATRSRLALKERLEKSKEDVDDLRFQLKEKSIELEGTKAQLRVIESKSTSKSVPSSTVGSPERTAASVSSSSPPPPTSPMLSASHPHPQLHHHHPHHHHHHHPHMLVGLRGESGPRLLQSSSQVSTPSMKAMTPVAMDDIVGQQQQHNSNTESTQDQPDRDGSIGAAGGRLLLHQTPTQQQQQQLQQPPETPRRRPSKIPLPGTKGSAAPKPPTGRNFSATPTPTTPTAPVQRPLGGGSSGPPSNRSLTKSTGSLYVKSTDTASSFGQQQQQQHQHHHHQQQPPQPMARTRDTTSTSSGSLYRADSALSWRTSKDTPSLEKSRSSSIPVSAAGSKGCSSSSGSAPPSSPAASTRTSMGMPPPPVPPYGIVCSSPQPRAKRDNLTSKVKNCDSLSRLQSAQVSTYGVLATGSSSTGGQQLSKSGSRKELSAASPGSGPPERKGSTAGGGVGGTVLRHASTASIGSTGQSDDSASVTASTSTTTTTTTSSSNVKARRNNTFRLAKPTLTPLAVPDHTTPAIITTTSTTTTSSSGSSSVGIRSPPPPLPGIARSPDMYASSLRAIGRVRSRTATGSATAPKISTTPTASTPATTVRAACSTSALSEPRRDLIGEYLAAKNRQSAIPPPIFHVRPLALQGEQRPQQQQQQQRQIDELAYKHPLLLMDTSDEEDEQEQNAGQESLIVPSPKLVAFQSPGRQGETGPDGCRLVGKVNPNILKTWEQLVAGGIGSSAACAHQQQREEASPRYPPAPQYTGGGEECLVLSSGGSDEAPSEPDERQSCLLYCPQRPPHGEEELVEFKVNRLRHASQGDGPDGHRGEGAPLSVTTTATTARNSSDGGVDFYDSIDAVSTCVRPGTTTAPRDEPTVGSDEEEEATDAGEALAELTSLDRKRLLWSIAIE
ncbi:serine-rich adhesin for platelets isoform X2 [Anopheles arabiensis]|nr:serine-rich adhesin for platelets isoform X2 [Anopheles arabiensis]XP_040172138.1 serine-rich adhesin for platelets isoform X2 [Anopheles arabiensis]XP_040172139.1 serine-rich adhesin for platelets isoform X2 [Anopheles arabiensis]XP_040172140.1 serine-rich adhesin for platelets isoform X2 [Anopheles arabiensis]XP_040172142.1 serine-rich adhesin for platelets isoform X2 [Anopheles arabiensis]XP_040172143.1 serine-rich adhesin for platelets isoform X2 [Anopheles arabiensis]